LPVVVVTNIQSYLFLPYQIDSFREKWENVDIGGKKWEIFFSFVLVQI